MNFYDTNVTIVLAKLNDAEYEQRVRDYHHRTYREFKQYLDGKGVHYSADMAHAWLQLSKENCAPCIYQERFRSIKKLMDVFELGHVRPAHLSSEKVTILPSFEDKLSQFLVQGKSGYTKSSCRDYRMHYRRFLRFLQGRGITELSQLSYAILDEYLAFLPHNDQGISMTGMFLRYLSGTGGCAAGLCWYFHYHHEAWLLCPRDLTPEQHARIEACRMEGGMFPLDKYQEASGSYLAKLKGLGYWSTVLLHS